MPKTDYLHAVNFSCRLFGLNKLGGSFFTTRGTALCVGCYWAISIAMNGPYFAWGEIIPRGVGRSCAFFYVDHTTLQIYSFVKIMITFFIPLLITWIAYCKIIHKTIKSWKTVRILFQYYSQLTLSLAPSIVYQIAS